MKTSKSFLDPNLRGSIQLSMRNISTEVIIEAPCDVVWNVLTDLSSYESWNRFLPRAEGLVQEGRSCKIWAKPPGPFTHRFRARSLRVSAGKEWVWSARLGNIPGINEIEISYILVAEGPKTRFLQKKFFSGFFLFFVWRLFVEKVIFDTTCILNEDVKSESERRAQLQVLSGKQTEKAIDGLQSSSLEHQISASIQSEKGQIENCSNQVHTISPSVRGLFSRKTTWVQKDPNFWQAFSGNWALLTGFSSDLGQHVVQFLAQKKMNLILVGRDPGQQKALGLKDFDIQVRFIQQDLADPDSVLELKEKVDELGIRVRLIFNGARVDAWGYFESEKVETHWRHHRVNTLVPVEMCLAFREHLASHLSAVVLNVSSTTVGWQWPYMTMFNSAKSFVLKFSQSLYSEWIWQGILVTCVQDFIHAESLSTRKMLKGFGLVTERDKAKQEVNRMLSRINWDCSLLSPSFRNWRISLVFKLFSSHFLSLKLAQWNRPPVGGLLRSREALGLPSSKTCTVCSFEENPLNKNHVGFAQGNTEKYREVTYALWKCPKCQTVLALDPVDFKEIYTDYALSNRKLDDFARTTYAQLIGRLVKAGLRKEHRILDLGCGNGVLVKLLAEKGFAQPVGYDPYVEEYNSPPEKQSFDCVVANDVIEHVEDPRQFIQECLGYLKPGGLLYIGTCDSESVNIKALDHEITRLHQPFHRILFTQKTLLTLGEESGAQVVSTYRRSYMDTLKPFANYRFLDEACRVFDRSMDDALDPWSQAIYMFTPRVWFFGFFGYFFPSAYEPAVILKKR